MLDYLDTAFSGGIGLLGAATTYLVGKVISTDKALASHISKADAVLEAHIASADAIHQSFKEAVVELKAEARDTNIKLDKLIDQNLSRAYDAASAKHTVSVAAATALDVVEAAKVSALTIIAQAAEIAKKTV